MLKKWSYAVGLLVLTGFGGGNALATSLSNPCSGGTAVNGIAVSNVTGDMGGSSDCFGTFEGAHPGEGSELSYLSGVWLYLSGMDISGDKQVGSGIDIGLSVTYDSTKMNGGWSFDGTAFSADSFMIVLATESDTSWAAYLFDGLASHSSHGSWSGDWNQPIGHLSVYVRRDTQGHGVPEPDSIILLGLALIVAGIALSRSRRKKR